MLGIKSEQPVKPIDGISLLPFIFYTVYQVVKLFREEYVAMGMGQRAEGIEQKEFLLVPLGNY
ncbi:MAG: hypothetical protein GH151_10660 [Bacteroidetes bacterium]|nr:hypothetical protein [Bacteroidota bacterium]